MKVDQQGQEPESPVKTAEANPPKLTPLRWKSAAARDMNLSSNIGSFYRAQEPSFGEQGPAQQVEVRHSPSAKRPNQAQLRAHIINSLSLEAAGSGQPVFPPMSRDHVNVDGRLNVPSKEGSPHFVKSAQDCTAKEGSFASSKLVDRINASERGELAANAKEFERPAVAKARLPGPEQRHTSENSPHMPGKKQDEAGKVHAEPAEEIIFQPVDLDQKYHEKELVRHYTAAKIQNREEALLNKPNAPGMNNSRNLPVGEEPAAMTIEFLRARLQAERSASKATKLKIEQLSKKVLDLENRLVAETDLRKTAETSLQDALSKLKKVAPQADHGTQPPALSPPRDTQKVADAAGATDPKKTVLQADAAGATDANKTVLRVDAAVATDANKTVLREDAACATEANKTVSWADAAVVTEAQADAAVVTEAQKTVLRADEKTKVDLPNSQLAVTEDKESESRKEVAAEGSSSVSPAFAPGQAPSADGGGSDVLPKGALDSSGSGSSPERALSPNRQRLDKRAAIEERLRSMWAKIGEEMAALAEVRGEMDVGNNEVGLVSHLSTGLEGKLSGESGGGSHSQADSSTQQTKEKQVSGNRNAANVEKRPSFKRNSSLANNVAKLVEQFEFQENVQREWEEAHQSSEGNEDELPALVTRDGDVVAESDSSSTARGGKSQGEKSLKGQGGHISRSKSLGMLPSQGVPSAGVMTRKSSANGRIEILEEGPTEDAGADDDELVYDPETEVAEELPNGIYLHHSRNEVNPYPRSVKETLYRKGTERVGVNSDIKSPSRAGPPRRDRFHRTLDDVDQQGWSAREVQDRPSREMYYEPIINNRGMRVDASYGNSDLHRTKTMPERSSDDLYRSGLYREGPGLDRVPWQEERRFSSAGHYSHEDPPGMSYGYHEQLEQDPHYRGGAYRNREDAHRGLPPWQEGDPGMGNRGMGHMPYGYAPPYRMDDSQQAQYGHPGMHPNAGGYGQREMPFNVAGSHLPRSDYYAVGGLMGPRPPMNGCVPSDRHPPAQIHPGWENVGIQEVQNTPVVVTEEAPQVGEASEVLKALRIAKQQIKGSQTEQAAFMTAQYTVSQEHRYGAGGQVSKTSYTVEAPLAYPRVTKTIQEGWHLEGGKQSLKKGGGYNGPNGVAIDLTGANVTELINGTGPLAASNAESSYVEKLNVGRGIQFFFSG